MVKVKNVEGHFDNPSGYSSWIDYWEEHMKQTANNCERKGCKKAEDIVGAHVYKQGNRKDIYLIPLCKSCNHYTVTDEFDVPENKLLLVPKKDLKPIISEEMVMEFLKERIDEIAQEIADSVIDRIKKSCIYDQDI